MKEKIFDIAGRRILVAGYRGMVGGAIMRRLGKIDAELIPVGRKEVDLVRQDDVERYFIAKKPDVVVMAAGKVGGIAANNTQRAEFLYDNIAMAANVYREDWKSTDYGDMVAMGLPADYPNLFNPKGLSIITEFPKPPIHPPEFDGYYYMPLPKERDGRSPTWTQAVLRSKDETILVSDPWFEGISGKQAIVWNTSLPNRINGISLGGGLLKKKAYGFWFDFNQW